MLSMQTRTRGWLAGIALAAVMTLPHTVRAQSPTKPAAMVAKTGMSAGQSGSVVSQPLPTSVLLFPVMVTGEGGAVAPDSPATRQARDLVTEALRKYLTKGGVGVVVYSNRLASIQRSVAEGSLKQDDAVKGPGDDPRKAQRLSDIIGATEYITATVDNYKYDTQSRRATFNLSLFRNAAEGTPLGTSAEKAVGDAPGDVAAPRQEGSATARAADVVAEQVVLSIYPQSAPLLRPVPKKDKKRKRSALGYIIPAAAVGVLLAVPR